MLSQPEIRRGRVPSFSIKAHLKNKLEIQQLPPLQKCSSHTGWVSLARCDFVVLLRLLEPTWSALVNWSMYKGREGGSGCFTCQS